MLLGGLCYTAFAGPFVVLGLSGADVPAVVGRCFPCPFVAFPGPLTGFRCLPLPFLDLSLAFLDLSLPVLDLSLQVGSRAANRGKTHCLFFLFFPLSS